MIHWEGIFNQGRNWVKVEAPTPRSLILNWWVYFDGYTFVEILRLVPYFGTQMYF